MYYAQHAAKFLEPQPLQVKDPNAGRVYLSREPLGVVYAIEPWNFPYYQLARVAGPQLAAGNTMIVKHAENVPQAALAFEKLLADAGAPKGVYTNVFISHELSNTLIADQRVRGVALTGSERAGAAVATEAAKNLKKSTLELGGADAFIVLDDADVDKAADWAVLGRHWNAGQVCVSSKRLIVDDSVYDRFMDRYRAGVAALKAGDPMDRSTTLAPLSSDGAASRLQSQVEQAIANGAKAEQVGDPVPTQGNFFQPTILTDIAPDNPARHEEFFGPVSQVYRVSGEEEAIKVANDSPYGLGGSVFTSDPDRGERVSQQVDTGMIFVNHPTGVKADIPFGGVKNSGYGHELIDLGFNEFLNIKVIGVTDIDAAF
ncbi:aldehyde dehydrogenase family protein [Naumannella halotolerans]|uniref:aldehyde dehydrogenase family protein n=1 Tax=Naumannella halotolerans TaxID=993414 RepID=UPI00370DCF9E